MTQKLRILGVAFSILLSSLYLSSNSAIAASLDQCLEISNIRTTVQGEQISVKADVSQICAEYTPGSSSLSAYSPLYELKPHAITCTGPDLRRGRISIGIFGLSLGEVSCSGKSQRYGVETSSLSVWEPLSGSIVKSFTHTPISAPKKLADCLEFADPRSSSSSNIFTLSVDVYSICNFLSRQGEIPVVGMAEEDSLLTLGLCKGVAVNAATSGRLNLGTITCQLRVGSEFSFLASTRKGATSTTLNLYFTWDSSRVSVSVSHPAIPPTAADLAADKAAADKAAADKAAADKAAADKAEVDRRQSAEEAVDAANAATDAANMAAEAADSITSALRDRIDSALELANSAGIATIIDISSGITACNNAIVSVTSKRDLTKNRYDQVQAILSDVTLESSIKSRYTSASNSWLAASRAYQSIITQKEREISYFNGVQAQINSSAAGRTAADKAVADKAAADKAAADKAAADKAAADKAAADKAAADKAAADKAAADKAAADLKAKQDAEAKSAADLAAQKLQQDDFNLVMRNYEKLMLRIYNLKIKYPSVSNLSSIEAKMLKLPIILGDDLSTAKYNIKSVNSSLDTSEKVWEKTQKATITCLKGKLTKKVTAVKPKCPSGYKVKK